MTQFLFDVMLGRLSTYLRMCGYDTAYALDVGLEADDAILDRTKRDGRTLVTRDRELAGRAPDAVLLDSRELTDQLGELAEAGIEVTLADPPVRCSVCNGELDRVDPQEPTPAYAPSTTEFDIWRCVGCGQHFWKGSHWDDVADRIADIE